MSTPRKRPRTQDECDDMIDAWHEGGTGVELHEYLGWTWAEYAEWAGPRRVFPDPDREVPNETP